MTDTRYDPNPDREEVAERWDADALYRTPDDDPRPKWYALTMFPYTSGDLHIGHWYAMAPSDVQARYKRMRGYNVLFPMGFDAFGLPAENAAIKRASTRTMDDCATSRTCAANSARWAPMFDWEREVVTCRPRVLQVDAMVVPPALQARAGLPLAGAGQLVPFLSDGARQRAGPARRHLRALPHP